MRFFSRRLGLPVLLFALTVFTTMLMGAGFEECFQKNEPLDLGRTWDIFTGLTRHPGALLAGIPFSFALLGILLAHEFGHYFACRHYGIDATLPYFLPAPTLIGTFGAFILIRSPIYSRRALFDVGVAGPLAGFALILPALTAGVAMSKTVAGIGGRGDFAFGAPLILRFFERMFFPGAPSAGIYLHPVAVAAWGGLLATALNLLPIGQLDGGHIMYSFFGEWHRILSRVFVAALVPLGLYFREWSWLAWALVLFLFALRHPVIVDRRGMGAARVALGCLALAIFLLSFTPVPLRFNG